ncbi:MAG: hypothetical protein PHN47_03695 [Clostridia bacterium]|jgi:hypothetical protein|nr:hypothetical protein [Clostridia bacterium]MDD4571570.1 hypothetical protein [Clostridia bacterium]
MYILIILIYLIVALPELYILYKNKKKKETWIYSVTILFAFVISILLLSGIQLPQPIKVIESILGDFVKK